MPELAEYNKKRNFKKTSEPEGKVKRSKGALKFLVQKHQASRLHFDFRIEVDGVLKSWAVPKGPPKFSKERHLAMMVEDHPYDYRTFEGNIPEPEYGAGTVMLWDEGTYHSPGTEDRDETEATVRAQIAKGSIKVVLDGKKLKGQFALVRFPKAGENAWLMIKDKDEYEGKDIKNEDLSVKTGRTLKEIEDESKKNKKLLFGPGEVEEKEEDVEIDEPEIDLQPVKISKPISPMLATLVDLPFDNKDWIFEIKWDGYRAIANVNSEVELMSRNNQLLNNDYPPIVDELSQIKEHVILDGEITVVDENGRSDFQLLQNYRRFGKGNLIYYVFDILEYKNKDLRKLPLIERKEILKKFLPKLNHIKFSDHIEEHGKKFYKLADEKKLEGIIAKQKDSQYIEDTRSDNWQKIKLTQEQEVVVGGYTHPEGSRKAFGSLLIGIYEGKDFKYIGHVGSGFNNKNLEEIKEKLDKHASKSDPFVDAPRMNNVAQWIKPKVVAQVKFHGWTESGYMRQAIFIGLRTDKKPEDISKEIPKKSKATKNKPENFELQLIIKNEDKIFWPKEKYTKGDLIKFYDEISEFILPYQINRAQNLNRFPNGIKGKSFFQKDFDYPPEFARTEKIYSDSSKRTIDYLVCDNKETLLYMANIGCIEINPWNSQIDNLDNPDYLIFDLDADAKHFDDLVTVAQGLHKLLDEIEVPGFCKTSGKRGLHVNVPLGGKYDFDQVRAFGELISIVMQNRLPEIINLERDPDLRKEKVYIDYLQNRRGQTTASVYSVRPVDGATVSTPLKWSEVNSKLDPKDFTIKTLVKRLDKVGDLYKDVLGKGIALEKTLKQLNKLLN